jgi:hypothetical protein
MVFKGPNDPSLRECSGLGPLSKPLDAGAAPGVPPESNGSAALAFAVRSKALDGLNAHPAETLPLSAPVTCRGALRHCD